MLTPHGVFFRDPLAGFSQESRDELQRTKDQAETNGEELEVCRQQSAELEMRLQTVQARGPDCKENACIVCAEDYLALFQKGSHSL